MVALVLELAGAVGDGLLAVLGVLLEAHLVGLQPLPQLDPPRGHFRVGGTVEHRDQVADVLRQVAAGGLGLVLRPGIGGEDRGFLHPDLRPPRALLGQREARGQHRNEQRGHLVAPGVGVRPAMAVIAMPMGHVLGMFMVLQVLQHGPLVPIVGACLPKTRRAAQHSMSKRHAAG
jgi:hypothetical protein